jgi:hypothetical protein
LICIAAVARHCCYATSASISTDGRWLADRGLPREFADDFLLTLHAQITERGNHRRHRAERMIATLSEK